MKKKVTLSLRKLLCVALALLMISGVGISATAAEGTAQKNYIIDNPYEGIDWDEWDDYKTQLHCHTNASDGYLTIEEF